MQRDTTSFPTTTTPLIHKRHYMFYFINLLYCAIRKRPSWYRKFQLGSITVHAYATHSDYKEFHGRSRPNNLAIVLASKEVYSCSNIDCNHCPVGYNNIKNRPTSNCYKNITYILSRPIYKKEPRC